MIFRRRGHEPEPNDTFGLGHITSNDELANNYRKQAEARRAATPPAPKPAHPNAYVEGGIRKTLGERVSDFGERHKGTMMLIGAFGIVTTLSTCSGHMVDSGYGPEKAVAFAEGHGYEDVHFTDSSIAILGVGECGRGYDVTYKLEATNAKGESTPIKVCVGAVNDPVIRGPR